MLLFVTVPSTALAEVSEVVQPALFAVVGLLSARFTVAVVAVGVLVRVGVRVGVLVGVRVPVLVGVLV